MNMFQQLFRKAALMSCLFILFLGIAIQSGCTDKGQEPKVTIKLTKTIDSGRFVKKIRDSFVNWRWTTDVEKSNIQDCPGMFTEDTQVKIITKKEVLTLTELSNGDMMGTSSENPNVCIALSKIQSMLVMTRIRSLDSNSIDTSGYWMRTMDKKKLNLLRGPNDGKM